MGCLYIYTCALSSCTYFAPSVNETSSQKFLSLINNEMIFIKSSFLSSIYPTILNHKQFYIIKAILSENSMCMTDSILRWLQIKVYWAETAQVLLQIETLLSNAAGTQCWEEIKMWASWLRKTLHNHHEKGNLRLIRMCL